MKFNKLLVGVLVTSMIASNALVGFAEETVPPTPDTPVIEESVVPTYSSLIPDSIETTIFKKLFDKFKVVISGETAPLSALVLTSLDNQRTFIDTTIETTFSDETQLTDIKAYGFSKSHVTAILDELIKQKELFKTMQTDASDGEIVFETYEVELEAIVTAVYNNLPEMVKTDLAYYGDEKIVFDKLLNAIIDQSIGNKRKNRANNLFDSETFVLNTAAKTALKAALHAENAGDVSKEEKLSSALYELGEFILDVSELSLKNEAIPSSTYDGKYSTAFDVAFELIEKLQMVTTTEYGTAPDDNQGGNDNGDDNNGGTGGSPGGSPGGSTGETTKPSTPDSDLDEDDQKKLDEVEDQLPQAGDDATDAQKEAAKDAVDDLLDGVGGDLDSAKDADAQVKAVAGTVGKTLEVLDGEKAAEVAEEFADLVGAALENPNVSVEEQQEMVEDAIENTFSKLTSNEDASDADLLDVKEEIANLVETVVQNAATLEVLESTTPQAGEEAVEGLKAFELSSKDLAATLKTAVATQADLVKSLEANGLTDVAKTVEKNIKLSLPEVKAMEQVSLKLDAEAAKSLGDSGVGMTVEAKGINFKLPAALMQAAKSGLSVASKPVTRADNLNQVTDAGKVSNLKTVNVSVENGEETVKGMVELSFSLADLKDVDLDALAVGVFEDGQWTKLDFAIENGQVIFTAPHFSIYSLMTFTPSFEDVDTSWAKQYITSLTARGVVSGKSATAYDPNGTLTRAEFTTMLVKHLGLTDEVKQNFKDVSSDEWYYTYVGQAGLNSLAVGMEAGNFMPNEPITREDMAVMMYRAYKLKNGFNLDSKTTPFSDNSEISESARDAVYAVRTNGIISGYPDNTFKPEANATRAEAAAMMYLFLQK